MPLPEWAFWLTLGVMVVGLVGTLVPVLPGVELIWLAALVYAIAERFATIDPLTFAALTALEHLGQPPGQPSGWGIVAGTAGRIGSRRRGCFLTQRHKGTKKI
jgi:hypothetical protein